jgi:hypothetical protein
VGTESEFSNRLGIGLDFLWLCKPEQVDESLADRFDERVGVSHDLPLPHPWVLQQYASTVSLRVTSTEDRNSSGSTNLPASRASRTSSSIAPMSCMPWQAPVNCSFDASFHASFVMDP